MLYTKREIYTGCVVVGRGDEIIVAGYSYDVQSGLGRSGLGYVSQVELLELPH